MFQYRASMTQQLEKNEQEVVKVSICSQLIMTLIIMCKSGA